MPDPDLIVEDHGTVALLRGLSEAGNGFIRNSLDTETRQWLGGSALAVEPRLVPDLLAAAREAGLDVDTSRRGWYDPGASVEQWNASFKRKHRARRAGLN